MSSKILLITLAIATLSSLSHADGDGEHHHVIIHVPYKIHTIRHTIVKHVHHKDKGDKYEVLGYTVGKPQYSGHHFAGGDELDHHHDFSGGNELGQGHEWSHHLEGGGHFQGHVGGYGGYD